MIFSCHFVILISFCLVLSHYNIYVISQEFHIQRQ